jgi:hypothetical protein
MDPAIFIERNLDFLRTQTGRRDERASQEPGYPD